MIAVRYTVQTEVEIVLNNTYEDVAYLLNTGVLPSQLTDFENINLVESLYIQDKETFLTNGETVVVPQFTIIDIT